MGGTTGLERAQEEGDGMAPLFTWDAPHFPMASGETRAHPSPQTLLTPMARAFFLTQR